MYSGGKKYFLILLSEQIIKCIISFKYVECVLTYLTIGKYLQVLQKLHLIKHLCNFVRTVITAITFLRSKFNIKLIPG